MFSSKVSQGHLIVRNHMHEVIKTLLQNVSHSSCVFYDASPRDFLQDLKQLMALYENLYIPAREKSLRKYPVEFSVLLWGEKYLCRA